MDHEKWCADAIEQIETSISVGQTFVLKSLFTGTRWDELTSGEKKGFGRYFSNKVKDGAIPNVQKLGEDKAHHNKYIKTE